MAAPMDTGKPSMEYAIDVNDLRFEYPSSLPDPDARAVLQGLTMQLKPGSRCLLIGANGAGKSTLLRVLAGKHLTKPEGAVKVMDKDAFRDLKLNLNRAFLDTNWGMRTVAFAGYGCPLQADIRVGNMMQKLQESFPERRDELIEMLGIDPNWRMHMVSDGQRRRVQLLLALVRPFDILLLDEVTTCLDVIVRQDLMEWLRRETEVRGSTVLYATHIFDGLDDWPTHIHYLNSKGATGWQGPIEDLQLYRELRDQGHPSPMLKIAVTWLRAELVLKKTERTTEREEGPGAKIESNPNYISTDRGGGFNPGRMLSYKA
ncbi:P-loop containing nucleoside triphosphate hydrolase protein [Pelagophyceae sp. CCMP2097]|nr:P-loop containing nucleoside triphosphate hydrolase protein [Pelagophyceae sp. CCMP2097]|mmetsp:Transcript_8536/g.29949  ORF Transcript_8536/g.29949 Transcript_8536/m.29949 type:complete len:317 (-) Transcript_8536:394-1344(-)